MFTNKKDLEDIQRRLNHIEANINKVIWMLREKPEKTIEDCYIEQFESEVEGAYNKIAKKKYPLKFTNFMNGRYKTIEEMCNHLKITESTARTYLKLAKKDGIQFNTRKSNGKLSYKVRKI